MPISPAVGRWRQTTPVPWRNGNGQVRELVRHPAAGTPQWRLSIADITADTAYSDFAGCRRVQALVEGAGLTLVVDGQEVPVLPDSPVHFDGAATVAARLTEGPVRALNLITDSAAADGDIQLVHAPRTVTAAGSTGHLVVVSLRDGVRMRPADGAEVTLDRFDWVRTTEAVDLLGPGPVAVVRVQVLLGGDGGAQVRPPAGS